MTMNATRRLAILVVLLFALRPSMHGQTTTTNTDCTINGNTANCTSTSTDNSAQIAARAAAQAEKDRQGEELGKSMGNALGRGILALHASAQRKHEHEAFCRAHVGEPYRTLHDGKKEEDRCPGTMSQQQLVDKFNHDIREMRAVGYADSSAETLTLHLEQANEMRFRALLANTPVIKTIQTAGFKNLVVTNDKEQQYVYDLVAGHVVTPGVPALAPTVAPVSAPPPLTITEAAEPVVSAGSSDTVTKAVAHAAPESAPAVAPVVAPAASPAIATGTADIPKPCFTDKSGHTVCLAPHQ